MATRYSAVYKNFAEQRGLTCSDLAPFWNRARILADRKFIDGSIEDGYWAYVWVTMTNLVDECGN